MNELEQWLADVKEYNGHAPGIISDCTAFEIRRQNIEARGKDLGLKLTKIKSMLARIRLKVVMPEGEGT